MYPGGRARGPFDINSGKRKLLGRDGLCIRVLPRTAPTSDERQIESEPWTTLGSVLGQYECISSRFDEVHIQTWRYNQRTRYNGDVGKGGAFLQLSGWLGTFELWAGATSDTDYLGNSGVLALQEAFVKDCGTNPDLPFTSIVDKGYYRSLIAAWRLGRTPKATDGSVQRSSWLR